MHGVTENSRFTRVVCTLIHLSFLVIAGWIYFGNGLNQLHGLLGYENSSKPDIARQVVLFSFGVVLFVRLSITLFYLLKRKFDWPELSGVIFAVFLYQILFAVLGAGESEALNYFDFLGIFLFILGSIFNTLSEFQRKWFKDKPENKGRLYNGGLFAYARHINYFGDSLWVTGWAMLTRNIWSYTVPAFITILFLFVFIPSLTKYLETRYSDQFEQYRQQTKTFIPFIY